MTTGVAVYAEFIFIKPRFVGAFYIANVDPGRFSIVKQTAWSLFCAACIKSVASHHA